MRHLEALRATFHEAVRAPFYCIPYIGKVWSRADVDGMELKGEKRETKKRSTLTPTLSLLRTVGVSTPTVSYQPSPNRVHELGIGNQVQTDTVTVVFCFFPIGIFGCSTGCWAGDHEI